MIGHTEKISSAQTFTDILNVGCDLDLERSNPIFPQDTPDYDAVLSNQVWWQTNQQFRRYNRYSHIFIIQALAVTLTFKKVNQFFCMTLWLMMLHNHTSFGNKMFVVQKIFCVTLIAAMPFFHRTLWYMICTIKSSLVANRPTVYKI